MTRFEKIQSMTLEELAVELCDQQYCIECPVLYSCKQDRDSVNGYVEWLKEEVKDEHSD